VEPLSDDTTYDVVAIRYGTLETSRSQVFFEYGTLGEADGPQRLDYFFYVLRRRSTIIVIDTGFAPAVGLRRGRTCLVAPVEALSRLGIDVRTVPLLVLTHLHYDHVGNADAFASAEIVVPRRELEFWCSAVARHPMIRSMVEQEELDRIALAEADGRIRSIDGVTDIAPGLRSYTIGGHSPGQQIIEVSTESGPLLLASDAAHLYEELERELPFHVVIDLSAMVAGFRSIRQLAAQRGATVVAGHDPEVMTRFQRLPGDLGELGVQLLVDQATACGRATCPQP
jgi:glyoxylase-like metal-dependent hydrolase (beta-lactamase superfamily II)